MRGLGILCYGLPGIGKTHWSLLWPKPLLCLSLHETGFEDLQVVGDVPEQTTGLSPKNYPQLLEITKQCTGSFKTLVIDSLSGFQQMFFDYLIESNIPTTKSQSRKEAEEKFWAFYSGPRLQAPNAVAPYTALLNSLLNAGTNVVLVGHKRNISEENVSGADYRRAEIDMDEGIRNCFLKWAPNCIYMSMEPNISTITKSTGYGAQQVATEGKAESLGNRLIYTSPNCQNSAKNKLKLPQFIPMGNSAQETFTNFWTGVPPVYKESNQ